MMKTKTKLKLKNNWKTKKINPNENHTDLCTGSLASER